jgi:hypothetical protein
MLTRRLRLGATSLLTLFLLAAPVVAYAAQDVTITFSSGNTALWSLGNFNFTEITTASTIDGSHGDGFDGDLDLSVCSNESCTISSGTYTAYAQAGTYNAANLTYTGAAVAINGLNVSSQIRISNTKAAARYISTFQNTSGAPITRVIKYYRNLGSDSGTYLKYSSDAQTISNQTLSKVGSSALWFISSDSSGLTGSEVPSDPINSFVYASSGASVLPTTDYNNGTVNTIYKITVPANSSVRIMILVGVGNIDTPRNTHSGALSGLKANLENYSLLPSDLKDDLDANTLATIQNWVVAPPGPAELSLSLTASATTASKGTPITITTVVSQPGLVTFYWNDKKIPGCIKKPVTTSVTCIWKPTVTGQMFLSSFLDPTSTSYIDSYSAKLPVFILPRSGTR